jgi:hypothetical protein
VSLSDHSPETLQRAIKEALDTAVQGATAMGFNWVRLDGALVLEDAVVVRMVASDDDSENTRDEEGPSVSTPLDPASDGF